MLDRLLSELTTPGVLWWIIPVVGCAVGAAILFVGGWAVARRRRPNAETAADSLASTSRSDRRVSFRREGSAVGVDVTDENRLAPLSSGWVVDRSLGGLCIEITAPRETGAVLSVRPSSASEMIPWTHVKVTSCRQDGERWQLGCRFVHTPPYSILMLFG